MHKVVLLSGVGAIPEVVLNIFQQTVDMESGHSLGEGICAYGSVLEATTTSGGGGVDGCHVL